MYLYIHIIHFYNNNNQRHGQYCTRVLSFRFTRKAIIINTRVYQPIKKNSRLQY